jgi:hypothetical protein
MTDRKEDVRKQAALCLQDAERTADAKQRAELIGLAEAFLRLARYEPIDLSPPLSEGGGTTGEAGQPATQQQIQPKKETS